MIDWLIDWLLYRSRRKKAHKSVESLNTIPSSDWLDPVEPSRTDAEQQSAVEKEPMIGTGRAISPKELEKELATITKRDDAHRLVNATTSPTPRCAWESFNASFLLLRSAVCYYKTAFLCPALQNLCHAYVRSYIFSAPYSMLVRLCYTDKSITGVFQPYYVQYISFIIVLSYIKQLRVSITSFIGSINSKYLFNNTEHRTISLWHRISSR